MFQIESRSQTLLLAQARGYMLDFAKKLLSETRRTLFVKSCRRPKFGVRGRVKFDLHLRFS